MGVIFDELHRPQNQFAYTYRFLLTGHKLHMIQINALMAEATWWCRDQFGPADGLDGVREPVRWRVDSATIEFVNEIDAIAFKVRWT